MRIVLIAILRVFVAAVMVHFLSAAGDLPLLTVNATQLTGAASVRALTEGTKVPFECNRRGVCETFAGKCQCQSQFGSSNGQGGAGDLGDCGHHDARYGAALTTATRPSAMDLQAYINKEENRTVVIRGGVTTSHVLEQQQRLAEALRLKIDQLAPPAS